MKHSILREAWRQRVSVAGIVLALSGLDASAAQGTADTARFRDSVITRVAEPVLPSTRAAEAVVNPVAATAPPVSAPAADTTTAAPAVSPEAVSFLRSAKVSRSAALEGRVSVLSSVGTAMPVAAANLEAVAQSRQILIERQSQGSMLTTLPAGIPVDLPAIGNRPAIQLNYTLSIPSGSEPGSPRKRLDTYVIESTGLTFDAEASAYQGEFMVVLANAEDPTDASAFPDPISVAVRASGARSIKPQPVQFSRLGQYETVALSVDTPGEDHFAVRVSVDPSDARTDPVKLAVSRPRVILSPGANGVLGWGIGTMPLSVEVRNIRSPQSYRVLVQAEAGEVTPNPIPIDKDGIGRAKLRSESTGAVALRVRNDGVESEAVQVQYRQPYAFFALAIAGGLLGAFLLGRGRKSWPKALAIGAASGVFGVAAYASGVISWLQALIGTDTLAGMTEIVVFFLGALVALAGVRAIVPNR
jgi:hypothetical protein